MAGHELYECAVKTLGKTKCKAQIKVYKDGKHKVIWDTIEKYGENKHTCKPHRSYIRNAIFEDYLQCEVPDYSVEITAETIFENSLDECLDGNRLSPDDIVQLNRHKKEFLEIIEDIRKKTGVVDVNKF